MAVFERLDPVVKGGPVVWVAATARGVCKVSMARTQAELKRALEEDFPGRGWRRGSDAITADAVRQLRAYFQGDLREFDVPLDLVATRFQLAVWEAVRRIPFGESRSYQEAGEMVGRERAGRAVGNAMNRCSAGIFIPCHRVVASGGGLGGWGSDIHWKRWLLDFEAACLRRAV